MGNSLAVQWLGLCAFTAEGLGSFPGQETKMPQAVRHRQKKQNKTKQNKTWCVNTMGKAIKILENLKRIYKSNSGTEKYSN